MIALFLDAVEVRRNRCKCERGRPTMVMQMSADRESRQKTMNLRCSWEDVRSVAEQLVCEIDGVEYRVWDEPLEMEWAEKTWNALSRKGLNSYENPCDKAYVKMQLLTLAAIFCKYLEIYSGKMVLIDYYDWFENSGIELANLENMVGKELTNKFEEEMLYSESYCQSNEESEDTYDQQVTMLYQGVDSDKVAGAVITVIRMQRGQVFDALLAEFKCASVLYVSLLETQARKDCLQWIIEGMCPDCGSLGKNIS